MTIQDKIDKCIKDTAAIMDQYPTVTCIRYELYDIPFEELRQFALKEKHTIHTDGIKRRAYIIHSPWIDKKYETDIFIYSNVVSYIPAQILSE